VQAGAKPSEVAAQQAEIDRINTELENAEKEHQRYVSLGQNVSSSQLDALRLRVDTTTRALATARERLASLTEVRPVDVELAQAELAEAIRNEERARAEFEASLVYSPADGRVVKIHAWPGEQVEGDGILELAPAGPMYVVAEIAESDIGRVKVGQRATIRAAALPTPLEGSVERIALKVLQNELTPIDPASFSDKRVVNAWIKVDDEAAIAQLLHLRVDVIIHP
jgi:HlyD family secretion protein